MSAFDLAWSVLKMPIYETGIPGIRFVTQGKDEPRWEEQDNVYGYAPADPSGGQGEIQNVTPAEFGMMTTGRAKGGIYGEEGEYSPREVAAKYEPGSEDYDMFNYYRALMDRAEAGEDILFGMPYVFRDHNPNMYHEGRHRMAELFARGHGDTPLPVKVMRGTHG